MPAAASPAPALAPPAGPTFALVGVGCSAGGLEALERFFSAMPAQPGFSVVVIQHLSPDFPSALPALLQRCTALPVQEVVDGMSIAPDHVYVIGPDMDVFLQDGVLKVSTAVLEAGIHLSVDHFFRALAEERAEGAVGVILSGMGSDGLLGAGAIKGKGGLVLAQDPLSAGAASMPRAVIDAGLVDIVALPEQMPGRISDFLKHPRLLEAAIVATDSPAATDDFDAVLGLLRAHVGIDFALYKTNTLMRRLERRIAVHRIAGLSAYVPYLQANPQEVDLLFHELLIGVTHFFRDPEVWDLLRDEVLPPMIAEAAPGQALSAWVPACSSGEEVYTLAITFAEALARHPKGARVHLQIYGTDLDRDAVDRARRGVFPANVMADVSAERIAQFFVEDAGGFRVRKEIREMAVFATQNIIADPPFTRLDLLCCRNLLIYFRAELQKRLLPLFHYALQPGGVLVLGSSESVGGADSLFAPIHAKHRLFRRLEVAPTGRAVYFQPRPVPARLPVQMASPSPFDESLEALTDQLIQQTYAPPAVLVNADGDILYVSGRTGRYLEPAAGKFNINIYAMAREGLREVLPAAIRKTLRENLPVQLNRLHVPVGAATQVVDVTVEALDKPDALRGRVLIVFREVATPPKVRRTRATVPSDAHQALLQELRQARESQQVTQEEMQASLEELRSSNEELQSTNEELQSTNEELTTSKEEMQSLNEELQTVNAELQSKVEDLTGLKNDMSNLLNSTQIATIFLDSAMRVRRFTSHAVDLFKLIPGDVGRPLSHVVTELDYPGLRIDAEEVLRTLIFQERQVGTHDGRWYRVRIMPYRTQENLIDGVVITFIDISEIRRLQQQLRPATP